MALEPLLMSAEIVLGGVGEVLRSSDGPARGRYPGIDKADDIQPVRHKRTQLNPGPSLPTSAKRSKAKDALPFDWCDPSPQREVHFALESKRKAFKKG